MSANFIGCSLCYLKLKKENKNAADAWWRLANEIGIENVFFITKDKEDSLKYLESTGYVLSCDIYYTPIYEMLSHSEDYICIDENHLKILWDIYESSEAET